MCFCKKRRLNCFLFSQFSELPMYFLFAMIDVLPAGLKSLGINKYRLKTARRPLKISSASSPYKPDTQNVCRPKYISIQPEILADYRQEWNFSCQSVAIDWYSVSSQDLLDKLCLSPRTDIPVQAVFVIFYCFPSFISQETLINLVRVKFSKAKPLDTSRKHFRPCDLFTGYFVTGVKLRKFSQSILTSKCKPFVRFTLDTVLGNQRRNKRKNTVWSVYESIDTKSN